jgi:hypothetical protein
MSFRTYVVVCFDIKYCLDPQSSLRMRTINWQRSSCPSGIDHGAGVDWYGVRSRLDKLSSERSTSFVTRETVSMFQTYNRQ